MFKKKINIIYFLPAMRNPSGGAKAIYHHSSLINSINNPHITSFILHYKKKYFSKYANSIKKRFNINNSTNNFGYNFKDFKVVKNFKPSVDRVSGVKIQSKNSFIFDHKTDFIIFPEIISHFAKDLCIKNNIKYAILAFGVYHMYQTNNLRLLNEVYKKSEFFIDISNDTRKCIKNIFPKLNKKFFRINLSINPKFSNGKFNKKQNIITCMPRKLKNDFHLLKFFLSQKFPKNWKIVDLTDLSNKQIISFLLKSKIFLSFSNFEGLGLPPLEAALAGNKIIGYTGQAGKEYFKLPIFEKINKGDILSFSNSILYHINKLELDKKWHLSKNVEKQRNTLLSKYSLKKELVDLRRIISYIKKLN